MNQSTLAVAQAVAEKGLSLAEKFTTSAMVILTGFVIVFAVLILLIFIIYGYGKIVYKAQNRNKENKKEQEVAVVESVAAQPVATPEPVANDGIPEEVIAVISAAVATMYGSNEKVKIKSIKKSSGRRSAWANAGILDNTRPF